MSKFRFEMSEQESDFVAENAGLSEQRKEKVYPIVAEVISMMDSGELVDDELKSLCLKVFPEMEYQSVVKNLLRKF